MDITDTTGPTGLGPRSPQPKSWADVKAITGDLRDVPIDLLVQGRIDSEYELKPIGKCGLLGCKQVHGWGYIFAIPGHRYVNIGNCCADKYAKDALAAIKRSFNDWKEEWSRQESLREMIEEAREKEQWLASVEPRSVRGTALKNSFLREFRGQLELNILERAEKKQPRVEHHVSVTLSTQDARRAMLQGGRVDVVEKNLRVARFDVHHIGDLRGLGIFVPQRDPVSLWIRFVNSVNVLLKSAGHEQSLDDMQVLHRIRRNFAAQYNDLVGSLKAADEFFSQKNLDLVARMPINRGKGINRITVEGSEVRVHRTS